MLLKSNELLFDIKNLFIKFYYLVTEQNYTIKTCNNSISIVYKHI